MPKFYALFFAFYGFLWKVALPLLRRNKRIKDGFAQRQIPDDWLMQDIVITHDLTFEKNPDKPFFGDQKDLDVSAIDIWIQAASGGEAYLACELIKSLPKNIRSYRILVTTWTRQGMQILTKECAKLMPLFPTDTAPFIQIRFAPLDTKEAVTKSLLLAKPKVCVMLETELWPCFMLVCKQRNIPFYVVNGRMSKSTFELYKIISPVLNYVAPKQILAMTNDDMKRFFHIFSSSLVGFMPNIKFDTAWEQVNTNYTNLLDALTKKEEQERSNEANVRIDSKNRSTVTKKEFLFENSPLTNTESEKSLQNNEQKSEHLIQSDVEFYEDEQCLTDVMIPSLLDKKTYLPALPMLFSKAQKTFLFASIRQEEENFFSSVLWKIYPQRKNDIFIIAPRHMHRIKHWRRRFYDLGMKYIIASDFFADKDFSDNLNCAFEPATCIIWDIFGDLSHLYAQSDMAIVGGSYKNLGGQNFLEAIASGAKTHVGMHIDNFMWALGQEDCSHISDATANKAELLQSVQSLSKKQTTPLCRSLVDIGLLRMHKNKKSLENTILAENKCKQTPHERLEIQKQFLTWLENRCGGSTIAIERLLQTERI